MIHFTLLLALVGWVSAEGKKKSAAEKKYHGLAPGIRFGGNLRLRGEFRDFRFNKALSGHDDEFLLSRLRINRNLEPADGLMMFVEAQDSRIFFEDQIDEKVVPTIFADALDLHQAFVDIKFTPRATPMKARLGRQKLRYGQERLVGAFEWSNTARVFDAIKLSIGEEKDRLLDLFSSRVVPVDHHNFNDWSPTGNRNADSDFHGVYYIDSKLIPETQFEAYWLLRREDNGDDEIHTLVPLEVRSLGCGWEIAGQFGDFGRGIDHGAFALHLARGYTGLEWNPVRLGMVYNFATGDDVPNDKK